MEKQVVNFKTWLLENHVGMDTRVGDLARDVKRDEGFPGTDVFEDLYDYILDSMAGWRKAGKARDPAYGSGTHQYWVRVGSEADRKNGQGSVTKTP